MVRFGRMGRRFLRLWFRGGWMGLEKKAVVLRTTPTHQNRCMGHPAAAMCRSMDRL